MRRAILWAALPVAAVLVVRALGNHDLDINDQAKQALYVRDILDNGNWILPTCGGAELATKPPLLVWLISALAAATGSVGEWALLLPTALSFVAASWLVFTIGRERWGDRVAVLAVWAFASAGVTIRLAMHVRPDMLMTLCVVAACFAGHRCQLGRPRGMAALFWIGLALSVLAKGPVGPVVILGALAVTLVSRRERGWAVPLLRSRWAWALVLPAIWFVLAVLAGGSTFLSQVVMGEFVDAVLAQGARADKGRPPGALVLMFIQVGLPWTVLSLTAALSLCRREARRGIRADLTFPALWLVPGLVLLSLSAAQRTDYVLPVMPAAALLAAAHLGGPGRPTPLAAWRGLLALFLLLTVALATVALLGLHVGSAGLDEVVAAHGPRLGVSLLVGASLLAAGLAATWPGRRRATTAPEDPGGRPVETVASARHARGGAGESSVRPLGALLLGAAGFLAVNLVYASQLTEESRIGKREGLLAFTREYRVAVHPDDEVLLFGTLRNSVRFALDLNVATTAPSELGLYLDGVDRGRRLLVVTTDEGAEALAVERPGRFRPLLRQPWDADRGRDLVLLEAVARNG